MPNPWYTPPAVIVDGTTADAADVNDLQTAVQAAFDALALTAGGTYTKQAKGNLGATPAFDLTAANYFTGTVNQSITSMTIIGETAGSYAQGFVMELTNAGAFTIVWEPNIDWQGGVVPTLTIAGKDILAFITSDNGATWHGMVSSLDSK